MERSPWIVMPGRRALAKLSNILSVRRTPRLVGNINSPGRAVPHSCRIARARCDKGTRWFRPDFAREAGTVQTSPSISSQRAPRTSPLRAAVKIKNSTARAVTVPRVLSSIMKLEMSVKGSAARCCTLPLILAVAGRICSRAPFHRAGLSPWRYLRAVAHDSTRSMRERTLFAFRGSSARWAREPSRYEERQ